MKTEPTQSAYPLHGDNLVTEWGLSKRELMALEFAKVILAQTCPDNTPLYLLNKTTSVGDEFDFYATQEEADKARKKEADRLMEKAIFAADALIDALNKESEASHV